MRWVQVRHLQPPTNEDILCYFPDAQIHYLVLWYNSGEYRNEDGIAEVHKPTHWTLIEKPK